MTAVCVVCWGGSYEFHSDNLSATVAEKTFVLTAEILTWWQVLRCESANKYFANVFGQRGPSVGRRSIDFAGGIRDTDSVRDVNRAHGWLYPHLSSTSCLDVSYGNETEHIAVEITMEIRDRNPNSTCRYDGGCVPK
ncbi:unnamed protein product [Soboliphyme baturini]|uniref:Retrotransposon protein n=1 Tax=Soboliphyme baturini TaxID=241478 RepID=A0A183J218_9BILA|nr:unnamed protein product [Soboliphyme baturini]